MAFNGSGTFLRVMNWVNDAAAGIKIRADRHDSEDDNFASGLSQCITKDGQTTITANLPMAGFKHTGVGAATATTDYARYDQLADGKIAWAIAGGTANAITASYSVPFTALTDGMLCYVRASAANSSTTPTFSPDGLTARTIVREGGSALAIGDITAAGYECILRYNLANTRWELLNPYGKEPLINNLRLGTAGVGASTISGYLANVFGSGSQSFIKFTNTATGQTSGDGFDVGIDASGIGYLYNKENQNLLLGVGNTSKVTITPTTVTFADAAQVFTDMKQAATTGATGVVELATAAEMATGTDTGRVPSVSVVKNHQGVAKAVFVGTLVGTTLTSRFAYGCSVARTGVGEFTVTLTTAMATAYYAVSAISQRAATNNGSFCAIKQGTTPTTTSFVLITETDTATPEDPSYFSFTVYGDQ